MRVYIETSVVSFLTARPNKDPIICGQQELTKAWWDEGSSRFELCYSEVVAEEAARGNAQAAQKRLERLDKLTEVPVTQEAVDLAERLIKAGALPMKAFADAMHVAVCVVNGIEILVSWNCKHIANVTMRGVIEKVCRDAGYDPARICTPTDLWGN
jgi:predicted nucleic acid-binding protein